MHKRNPTEKKGAEVFEQSLDKMIAEVGVQRNTETHLSGQETVGRRSGSEAIQLDIQLKGADGGIQLAKRLAEEWNIPLVVLNTGTNHRLAAEASLTIPESYASASTASVLQALSKAVFNKLNNQEQPEPKPAKKAYAGPKNAICVKDGPLHVMIPFEEIDFVKSDGNYVEIHWSGKKNVLKKTLKSIEEKLTNSFFQTHRSYIANIDKITTISTSHIILGEQKIPITKERKEMLLEMLNAID